MYGWARTTVGQVYDIVGGGTPSTSIPEYWEGEIPWISSADIYNVKDIRPRKKITKKAIYGSATHLVPANSIIVVTRVGLGKVALTKEPLCFSQDSQALIGDPALVYPEYALYYLSKAVSVFKYEHRGTTIAGVTKKQLAELPFYLPPYNEQCRIVSKIDELFSDLDVGISSLKTAKVELARYRQSVLAHAFSGKLTEDWRKTHGNVLEPAAALLERIRVERRKNSKNKYKEASLVDASNLLELPEGWEWTKLNEISEKITDGTHFTPNYVTEGVPFISVKDVRDGTISFADCKYIPQNEHDELIKRCHPEVNDVLITKSGTIGRIAVVKTEKPFSLFVSVALIKPFKNHINSEYLAFALEDYINHLDIQQSVKGGVIKNLHIEDLKEVKIPFLSIQEQSQIVSEFDRRFSIIDSLEKTIDQSLIEASRLRQSILKRAFEGKLVPQDPKDEPANILMERIKKEKT